MKSRIKRITAMLMISTMMMQYGVGIQSFANDEVNEAPSAEVAQEIKEEPKEEIKEEVKEEVKEAPIAVEAAAENKVEEASPSQDVAEAPAEENKEEVKEAVKGNAPVKTYSQAASNATASYKVTINLNILTSNGESETAVLSYSVASNQTKSITATTLNAKVKTKSFKLDGVTYKYESKWLDENGNEVNSISIKGAELTGATTLNYTAVFSATPDKKVTVHFTNIYKADGTLTESSESNTLSAGSGWNFTSKKLENKVLCKSFSAGGYKYEYTGKWVDQNGNEIDSFSIKNADLEGDAEFTYSPVYTKKEIPVLDFRYIDGVSTGSGSWKNIDDFSSMTHTFKQPESQEHYRFEYWQDAETAKTYIKGDKVTFKMADMSDVLLKEVRILAMWQPSVTVNYYSNGKLIQSIEQFDRDIEAYEGNILNINGAKFIGWFEGDEINASRVEEGTKYELPELTNSKVDRKVINLYAKYSTDYVAKHLLEDLDGNFVEKEDATEIFSDAVIGTTVKTAEKSFEGFTFDGSIEETLLEATVVVGLELKAFYTRNNYTVSYNYTGELIPEEAEAQKPADKSYKFEEEVPAAELPSVAGYVFSGWDGEVAEMPAENVAVTGSWEYADDVLNYNANGGSGDMEASEGKTFNEVAVKENGFARAGYTFEGWNTAADGSGAAYAAGSSFELTTGDDTLFAQWKAIPAPAGTTTPDSHDDNTPVRKPAIEPTQQPQIQNQAAPAAPTAPAAPAAEIIAEGAAPKAEAPKAEATEIAEDAAPKAAPLAAEGTWALLNLLATIFAVIGAAIAILRRKEENEEEEEEDNRSRKMMAGKIFGAIAAFAATAAFILTEDMSLAMVLADRWTILMAILLGCQIIAAVITKKASEADDEEEKGEDGSAAAKNTVIAN